MNKNYPMQVLESDFALRLITLEEYTQRLTYLKEIQTERNNRK